jgi:hypothetical protein
MYQDCELASGAIWSLPGDPRVTPVGWFLRWAHLDELPQLVNVLRGEMSLVGPRPERPEIISQFELALPHYRERLQARPGLTGLAQVQLPPDTNLDSVRRKLELDLCYVERMSLGLDLRILLATVLYVGGVPGETIAWLFRFPAASLDTRAESPLSVSAGAVIAKAEVRPGSITMRYGHQFVVREPVAPLAVPVWVEEPPAYLVEIHRARPPPVLQEHSTFGVIQTWTMKGARIRGARDPPAIGSLDA